MALPSYDAESDEAYQDALRRGDRGNRSFHKRMEAARAAYEAKTGNKSPSMPSQQLYEKNPFADLLPRGGSAPQPEQMAAPENPPIDQQSNEKNYDENPFADLIKPEEKKPELPWQLKALLSFGMNRNKPLSQGIPERAAAAGRGITDIGEGIKQAGLAGGEMIGAVPQGRADQYTAEKQKERELYEATPGAQDPLTQFIRSATSSLPLAAALSPLALEGGALAKIGSGAASGAGMEALKFTPKEQSRSLNALIGGTLGAAIPGVPAALKELTPSSLVARLVGSNLGHKELARNLEVTAGTQTGLGDVIGSPSLKNIQENVISKLPFSGAEASLKQTGKEILSRGEGIVDKYLGNLHPTEVSDKLGESLIKADATQTKIKNDLYKSVDNEAEKSGFELKLPDFSEKLREHAEGLVSRNIFDFEPKIKKLVTDISAGNNIRNLTVKEANIAASKLNRMANQYGQSPHPSDRNAARVLGDLGKALKSDIKSEIKNSGNDKLVNAFDTAEKNYGENFSDFLEKDLMKFTHGDKSPDDLLNTFLKTSKKSDKADQLEKLMTVLPKEDHDLVRASYFSRAIEGAEDMKAVNPNKLKTLWTDLGDKQKKILIPDEKERREFDNYVMLVGKNPKAVNLMWNPQTGQINSSIVTAIMAMHPLMSLKEIVTGRGASKLLTNENFRNKVVKKIIDRKGSNP